MLTLLLCMVLATQGEEPSAIETRFRAMDKAIDLLQASANRQPTTEAVGLRVDALTRLSDEREVTGQKAIDAALKSAKELVDIQNANYSQQMNQQRQMIAEVTKTFDYKMEQMLTRITVLESRGKGMGDLWSMIVACVGMVIGVLGVLGIGFGMLGKGKTTGR